MLIAPSPLPGERMGIYISIKGSKFGLVPAQTQLGLPSKLQAIP